jgi:hypothetical protein
VRRTAAIVIVLLALVAGDGVRAGGGDSTTLSRARALAYFARKHDRLWDYVEQEIRGARGRASDPEITSALDEVELRLHLDHAQALLDAGGRDAETSALAALMKALELDVPRERTAKARAEVTEIRFARANRLAGTEDGLQAALDEVDAVINLPGISDDEKARARAFGFDLAARPAYRKLEAGDYTEGYLGLERAVALRTGDRSEPVEAARRKMREIESITGRLTVALRDVSAKLRGVRPEVVGEILPVPRTILVVPAGPGVAADAAPVLSLTLKGNEPAVTLVRNDRTKSFALVARFPDVRPDLRVPFSLERDRVAIELPDRVPARMAYVPDDVEGGPFLIGLYEVSAGEWAAIRGARAPAPAQARLPATGVTVEELEAFLEAAHVRLPTRAEWTRAALGADGRSLPWGEGSVAERANIYVKDPMPQGLEPVESRPEGASPYGLRHVLGNAWELVEWTPRPGERIVGAFAMGGSYRTDYSWELPYERPGGESAKWPVRLLRDARPLDPALRELSEEQRRPWAAVLTDRLRAVNQRSIGFRVVVRLEE